MLNQALGIIEVVGLPAAVEAADVACKSANVELVGYELAKGGGYITVKILGQVGAVNAAIQAASTAAAKVHKVVSAVVIPRPNTQIDVLVHSKLTVGLAPAAAAKAEPEPEPEPADDDNDTQDAPDEPEAESSGKSNRSSASRKPRTTQRRKNNE